MESNIAIAINTVILIVMFMLSLRVGVVWQKQKPIANAVSDCQEQINEEVQKRKEVEIRAEKTEFELRETKSQLNDARNSIRVLNGSMLIMMNRMGIPYPDTLVFSPLTVRPRRSTISFVGVWAKVASLATLDLRSDLEGVLSRGNQRWEYRPLVGNVTGNDLEQELLLGGNADILYCASHADDEGVYFSDQKYRPEWLADVATRYGVKLVFLNACRTTSTARTLKANGVQSVVYALRDVPDNLAIEFAKSFFTALSNGNSVRDAVESGRRSVTQFNTETPKSMFGYYGDWSASDDFPE